MADHSKVQAALDTAIALAITKMKESEYASVLKHVESHVQGLSKTKDLVDDDQTLLMTYHEEFVKMCPLARDTQGRVHAPQRD